MTRLALLAVLLLALAPAVSRVLAGATPGVVAGWSELCTTMGLKSLPSDARPSGDAAASSPAKPSSEADCAYCPLAASLPLLLLACVLLPPALRRDIPLPAVAPRARARERLRGLGSRGPPVLL